MKNDLKIVMKNIDDLVPYEKNPRINDNAVDYVANSIKEFGFKVPIIIDKNNVIVAGHTRLKASKKLGLKKVPCIVANDLTDKQIKALRIADNKTNDYSIWDNKLLLDELKDLDNIFTGFSQSDFFDDTLDEKENSILDNNKKGTVYSLTFKTQNEELIDKIKQYIESEYIDEGGEK